MQRDTQLRGERRWTAVLCADLVDFTGISKVLGAERTYELLRDVVGAARAEIEAEGGHIIEYAGDALFAVFGAPKAAENASLDACRAALAPSQRKPSRR
jgi:class 3 adenylate cyclase